MRSHPPHPLSAPTHTLTHTLQPACLTHRFFQSDNEVKQRPARHLEAVQPSHLLVGVLGIFVPSLFSSSSSSDSERTERTEFCVLHYNKDKTLTAVQRGERQRCPNWIFFFSIFLCLPRSHPVLQWKMILWARCLLDGVSLLNTLLNTHLGQRHSQ